MRALYTSASGMMAQQFNLDVISNNLANVNTHGYKKTSAHFQDLFYQSLKSPGVGGASGGTLPTGSEAGLGVSAASTMRSFTQGTFQVTGNEYDVAIRGDGFFKIRLPDGSTGFTRDGALSVDAQGNLVTSDGYPLDPAINIPNDKTSVAIAPDGTVNVLQAGQTNPTNVGQLQLTRFINPAGLQAIGQNLFQETQASGQPITGTPGQEGLGSIAHKTLELPNVEVVTEMVNMITAQRAYESNSKAIIAADEMLQGAINIKR